MPSINQLTLCVLAVFFLFASANPTPQCGPTMIDIKAKYQDYIDTLNSDMNSTSLDPYIRDDILFNDFPPLTAAECVQNVNEVKGLLPGLMFAITQAVLEKDPYPRGEQGYGNLAIRANVSYNPEPGQTLSFNEYVIYRVEAGVLVAANSLVDTSKVPEKDQAAAHRL